MYIHVYGVIHVHVCMCRLFVVNVHVCTCQYFLWQSSQSLFIHLHLPHHTTIITPPSSHLHHHTIITPPLHLPYTSLNLPQHTSLNTSLTTPPLPQWTMGPPTLSRPGRSPSPPPPQPAWATPPLLPSPPSRPRNSCSMVPQTLPLRPCSPPPAQGPSS